MKYYLIAGEASGDTHGALLMKALKKEDPEAQFRVWGGDLMEEAGGELVKHYKDHAFMGIAEVVVHLKTIRKNIAYCKQDLAQYQPDVVIFIDYSGFNLRIAKFAKQIGLRTFYYVAPQIWAWRQYRIKDIKKYLDRVFIIFPFEKDFYAKHNYKADFVGYPLIDTIEEKVKNSPDFNTFIEKNNLPDTPIVALLPGSRKQELSNMLPVMVKMIDKFKNYQFVIAGTSSIDRSFYDSFLENRPVNIVFNQTYDLLFNARAALVTSGTATLETALLKVPEVVCYKTSWLTYRVVKTLIKIRFISLTNLVMDKEIVKELIQHEFTAENLKKELHLLLNDNEHRKKMLTHFDELTKKLGNGGAPARAAKIMYQDLKK